MKMLDLMFRIICLLCGYCKLISFLIVLLIEKYIFFILYEQEVEKENDKESEEGQNDFSVDVDEELQIELCKLWDMFMNSVR